MKPSLKSICQPVTFLTLMLLATCWVLSYMSVLSVAMLPILGFYLLRYAGSVHWKAFLCLFLLNPLSVAFMSGVVSYAKGAPTLRGMGLYNLEGYNIDRKTRCFRSSGGCMVSGNEWVYIAPHNSALKIMSFIFGPPSKSYDGPYPTKEEAFALSEKGMSISPEDFKLGKVVMRNRSYQLGTFFPNAILYRGFLLSGFFEDNETELKITASIYRERCLILRFEESYYFPEEHPGSEKIDFAVCLDLETQTPFAYYAPPNRYLRGYPPFFYLPEE